MNNRYKVNVTRLGDGFEFGQVVIPAEFPETFGTQDNVDRLVNLNALILMRPENEEAEEPTHDENGFIILKVPSVEGEGEAEVKIPVKTGEDVGQPDADAGKVKGADEAVNAAAEIEKLTKAAKP